MHFEVVLLSSQAANTSHHSKSVKILYVFQITAKSSEEHSRHYFYIIFKILVCVVLISILYMSQVSNSLLVR